MATSTPVLLSECDSAFASSLPGQLLVSRGPDTPPIASDVIPTGKQIDGPLTITSPNLSPTSGLANLLKVGTIFDPAAGNANYLGVQVNGVCNTSGSFAGAFTALRISPYLQSTTGATVSLLDVGTNTAAGGAGTHTSAFSVSPANVIAVPQIRALGGITSHGPGNLFNNEAFGLSSLRSNTTGDTNTACGYAAMAANTTGSGNTAVGALTLPTSITGNYNTAVGNSAMYSSTTGNNNTAVGLSALYANTIGNNNVAVGFQALKSSVANSDCTALGCHADLNKTTGNLSTALGAFTSTGGFTSATALGANAACTASNQIMLGTATEMVVVPGKMQILGGVSSHGAGGIPSNESFGLNSLDSNTTGVSNAAFGRLSLHANTTGSYNAGFGEQAMASNTTGSSNASFGAFTLSGNTVGNYNTAIGYAGLSANSTGNNNTGVGYSALASSTTGNDNTALGYGGLSSNTTGSGNIAIGYSAMNANTAGLNNTAVGYQSLFAATTLNYSVALGCQADVSKTVGDQCTALGSFTSTGGFIGSTALGANAACTASNQIMLGTATETVVLPGKLLVSSVFAPVSGSASYAGVTINGTCNSSGSFSGAFTAVRVSPYLQSVAGATTVNLLDLGTNSAAGGSGTHTSKFSVTSLGNMTAKGNATFGASSWLTLTDSGSGNGRFVAANIASFDSSVMMMRSIDGSIGYLRAEAGINGGRVSIGSITSPLATLHVFSEYPAIPAQIIQAKLNQSAPLTEWRASDGTTVLASVSFSGDLSIGSGSVQLINAGGGSGRIAIPNVGAFDATNVRLRNANGSITYINAALGTTGGRVGINGASPGPAGTLHVFSEHAAVPVQILQAKLNQTAAMTEWRADDGTTVLASISAAGAATLAGALLGTSPTHKVGFWGAASVVQPAAIANADGTLTDVTTKLNALLATQRTVGFIAA